MHIFNENAKFDCYRFIRKKLFDWSRILSTDFDLKNKKHY